MSKLLSTKPYMIRAIHEWCMDNGLTPHLLVAVDGQTKVPVAYVKNGEIVLNLNYSATKDLQIGADAVTFSARFSGVSNNLYVPINAVRGIFARENGQGMFFEIEHADSEVPIKENPSLEHADTEQEISEAVGKKLQSTKKPTLKLVK
jgi:stringent starvation protein B